MPSPNRVVLASAGSGKTTFIVREVAARPDQRAAITTYTTLNYGRIIAKFWEEFGGVPSSAHVETWYSFLLQDLARPYQNHHDPPPRMRIAGVNLAEGQSSPYTSKTALSYWLDRSGRVYSDKISEFILRCDDSSGGAVMARLARRYDRIYVDEVQDLAGYDLDLLERLMAKGPPITMVGDPRQGTYATNLGPRNKKFRGAGITEKFRSWERRRLCEIQEHNHSHRNIPEICALADTIHPGYEPTESRNLQRTDHDGIFVVAPEHLAAYMARYQPTILRHDRRADCGGFEGVNFGESKGLEFERVIVVPTGPIRDWLKTGDRSDIEKALAKVYVAVTRARQSVAFVYRGKVGLGTLLTGHWVP